MSKKVKSLIEREVETRLKGLDAVAVINPRGINATKTNLIRRRLHEKGMRMMVVKNSLARRAMDERMGLVDLAAMILRALRSVGGESSAPRLSYQALMSGSVAASSSSCVRIDAVPSTPASPLGPVD